MRDQRLRYIVNQMIPCCKGMRDEPEQDWISLARGRSLIGTNSQFPFDAPLYQFGIDCKFVPVFMSFEEQIDNNCARRYLHFHIEIEQQFSFVRYAH